MGAIYVLDTVNSNCNLKFAMVKMAKFSSSTRMFDWMLSHLFADKMETINLSSAYQPSSEVNFPSPPENLMAAISSND